MDVITERQPKLVNDYPEHFYSSESEDNSIATNKLILSLDRCIEQKSNVPLYNLAEDVLVEIYKIGKNGIQLTEEDGRRIGPLIFKCVEAIEWCLHRLVSLFDADSIPDYLIFISGLQFMLDNYGAFPTGDGKRLESSFESKYLKDFVSKFVTILERWKTTSFLSYDAVEHRESQLVRPKGIPEAHIWWWNKE